MADNNGATLGSDRDLATLIASSKANLPSAIKDLLDFCVEICNREPERPPDKADTYKLNNMLGAINGPTVYGLSDEEFALNKVVNHVLLRALMHFSEQSVDDHIDWTSQFTVAIYCIGKNIAMAEADGKLTLTPGPGAFF